MNWTPYKRQGKLPLERRSVLVMIAPRDPLETVGFATAATVAVGYIRIHSDGPFFVVPGVPHGDEDITHWCDCLGDDFSAPLWKSRQVVGRPRRQWNGSRHINAVTTAERIAL